MYECTTIRLRATTFVRKSVEPKNKIAFAINSLEPRKEIRSVSDITLVSRV